MNEEGNGKHFYRADRLSFLWGMERTYVTDCILGVDQKISDRLIKITFLGEIEMATKEGIKCRFWACGFLLNKCKTRTKTLNKIRLLK